MARIRKFAPTPAATFKALAATYSDAAAEVNQALADAGYTVHKKQDYTKDGVIYQPRIAGYFAGENLEQREIRVDLVEVLEDWKDDEQQSNPVHPKL